MRCIYDQVVCFKRWVQHHGLVRLDKAAATIQVIRLPFAGVRFKSAELNCYVVQASPCLEQVCGGRKKKALHGVEYQLSVRVAPALPKKMRGFRVRAERPLIG